MLLRDLRMPDFTDHAVDVPQPGMPGIGDTHVVGRFLRDVLKLNAEQRNFRIFGPDETLSNGLEAVFETTNRQWLAATVDNDEFLARTGQVMEMLSEHQCEGWLEGYLLTGRHGLFNCYEAFIHIVDSMFNQHAKWLKVTAGLAWRRKIASLNYLEGDHDAAIRCCERAVALDPTNIDALVGAARADVLVGAIFTTEHRAERRDNQRSEKLDTTGNVQQEAKCGVAHAGRQHLGDHRSGGAHRFAHLDESHGAQVQAHP